MSESKTPDAFPVTLVDPSLQVKFGYNKPRVNTEVSMLLKDKSILHDNLMGYLQHCYEGHFGVALSPDMILYTVLCELAQRIKANSKQFQALFTHRKDGEGKEHLIVLSSTPDKFEVKTFMEMVQKRTPIDTSKWMPKFTTTDQEAEIALGGAFLDGMQAYYEYAMTMCGIVAVRLLGTVNDWKMLAKTFQNMSVDFKEVDKDVCAYLAGCGLCVVDMIEAASKKSGFFFKNMYAIKSCGSGHPDEVTGWINRFLYKHHIPKLSSSSSSSTRQQQQQEYGSPLGQTNSHIATVPYKYIQQDGTEDNWVFMTGLFWSEKAEDKSSKIVFLQPHFAHATKRMPPPSPPQPKYSKQQEGFVRYYKQMFGTNKHAREAFLAEIQSTEPAMYDFLKSVPM